MARSREATPSGSRSASGDGSRTAGTNARERVALARRTRQHTWMRWNVAAVAVVAAVVVAAAGCGRSDVAGAPTPATPAAAPVGGPAAALEDELASSDGATRRRTAASPTARDAA